MHCKERWDSKNVVDIDELKSVYRFDVSSMVYLALYYHHYVREISTNNSMVFSGNIREFSFVYMFQQRYQRWRDVSRNNQLQLDPRMNNM